MLMQGRCALRRALQCNERHAALWQATQDTPRAIKVAAAASTLRGRYSLSRTPRAEQRWLAQLDALKLSAAPDLFAVAWAEGCGWDIENALTCALAPA